MKIFFCAVKDLYKSSVFARVVAGLDSQLKTQDTLAQKLRVLRHESGSLEFDIFQPKASFVKDEITTNGCTSRFLAHAGVYSMRRVVRSPERWFRTVKVAKEHGYDLLNEPDPQELEKFLAKQHREDPIRFLDLSELIVKLM